MVGCSSIKKGAIARQPVFPRQGGHPVIGDVATIVANEKGATVINDRDLLLRMLDLKADDFVDLRHVGQAYPEMEYPNNYRWIACIGESGREGRGPHYDKNEAMRQHPLNVGDDDIDDDPTGIFLVFETPPELIEALRVGDWGSIEAWINRRNAFADQEITFKLTRKRLPDLLHAIKTLAETGSNLDRAKYKNLLEDIEEQVGCERWSTQ